MQNVTSTTRKTVGRPMNARELCYVRLALASPNFHGVSRGLALDLLATVMASNAAKRAVLHTKN